MLKARMPPIVGLLALLVPVLATQEARLIRHKHLIIGRTLTDSATAWRPAATSRRRGVRNFSDSPLGAEGTDHGFVS